MAKTVRKLDFSNAHATLGTGAAFSTRHNNQIEIGSRAAEIYSVIVATAPEVNAEIPTKFSRVSGGAAMDIATGTWSALPVRPKSTAAGTAVIVGSLPIGSYILVVQGADING